MPLISFADHVAALLRAAERLCTSAQAAGLDATVPTCPGWSVRDLLAHQGMVHRWATAHVTGDAEGQRGTDAVEAAGLTEPDPIAWLHEGAGALATALESAPTDLDAFVFLKHPPAPREFWARRQCHETTVHAVDALAAQLDRMPSASEVGLPAKLSVDGIDELVTGFLTRRNARLRSKLAVRIALCPSDSDAAWLLAVGSGPVVATRHTADAIPDADVTLRGTAAQLYLGLWNRGDEIAASDAAALALWRELARVTWS